MDDTKHSQSALDQLDDDKVRELWLAGRDEHQKVLVSALRTRMDMRKPAHVDHYFEGPHTSDRSKPVLNDSLSGFRLKGPWKVLANISAVAILLSIGWFGGINKLNTDMSNTTSIYTTPNGERATVQLPDGSIVVLNVASRLEVPSTFASGDRKIKLTGEAMFSVKHHSKKPFTVAVGNTTAEVLGTKFIARSYPGDTNTVVAVEEGRVAVQSVVLNAGEQVVVSQSGSSNPKVALPGQFTFASGILTIKGQSLLSAIPELNRWYNVDIRLGNQELNDLRVIGEFASGSLGDLIEILETTFGVRVSRVGRVLTLYSKVQ